MSYLTHIRQCNSHDLRRFMPFYIADQRVGYVRPVVLDVLLGVSGFKSVRDGVAINSDCETFKDRTEALGEAAKELVAAGLSKMAGDELYGVKNSWEQCPLAAVNRGAAAALGIRSYGVHVNGWRREASGKLSIWTGIRAAEKSVAPGKLDNMIAGGQPIGLTLMQNLIKEAAEEANVSETLARRAKPVSCISYVMEDGDGLRPDVMFCYDLELPQEFIPKNIDGEMSEFVLLPAEEAIRKVNETDEYKFNVNLVVTDFAVRHGLLNPDCTPDYTMIVQGLRGQV
jgi:hypothetical protein